MRIAIVSDIHGNLTAFEAVLKDIRQAAPDLILHGGDLANSGANPAGIVDYIRGLGWPGVAGNADEILWMPDSLENLGGITPQMQPLYSAIQDITTATREELGTDRLEWMRHLPRILNFDPVSLMHASPENLWKSPSQEASDAELASVYGQVNNPIVVYGHVHHSFIRKVSGMTIANAGSVGLPYDGNRYASYLLLDESKPSIRRVEYDLEREIKALSDSGIPHADWITRILYSASLQMP